MIKIEAKTGEDGTKLCISITGKGEDIVTEAVHIYRQLPKQLKEANAALYFDFLANLLKTGEFGIGPKSEADCEDCEEAADV